MTDRRRIRLSWSSGQDAAWSLAMPRRDPAIEVTGPLTTADSKSLPAALAGRAFDAALFADLPAGVDPAEENGEFRSFVQDGPDFTRPLALRIGERSEREGFVDRDLLPRPGDGRPDRPRDNREERP